VNVLEEVPFDKLKGTTEHQHLRGGWHIMFHKAFLSLVAAAALGFGMLGMTSAAEAKHKHHHHHNNVTIGLGFPFFGGYPAYDYGYPGYGFYDEFGDCGYQWVRIKKWNRSHTHRVIVHRKRWVCY
jgi:hypothetical protein